MASTTDSVPAKQNKLTTFLNEVMVELKKTTWPTRKEAWRLTTVVIAVVVAVSIYIGGIDYVLTALTRRFGLIK